MLFIEIVLLKPMFTSSGSKPPSPSSKSLSLRTFDQVSNIKTYLKQVHLHLFYFDISAPFMQLLYFDSSPRVSSENTSDSDPGAAAQTAECHCLTPSLPPSCAHRSLSHGYGLSWWKAAQWQVRLWLLEPDRLLLTSSGTLSRSFRSVPPFPSYAMRMVITTSNFIGALWGWMSRHLQQT